MWLRFSFGKHKSWKVKRLVATEKTDVNSELLLKPMFIGFLEKDSKSALLLFLNVL